MGIVCESQVCQVTVHARGAIVTRRVEVPQTTALPDGDIELVIPEVTARCEAGSFRAQLDPGRRIVLQVESVLEPPKSPVQTGASQAKLDELKLKMDRLQAEIERLGTQRQRLAKQFPDPALRTTSLVEKVDERIADAIATAGLLAEVQKQLGDKQQLLEQQLADLAQEKSAAELRHSQAPSSEKQGRSQPTRRVTVRMTGAGPVSGLLISYVVPAARFFPTYTLRLLDGGKRASWSIDAHVAQISGEDWNGVRLSLSTADLIFDARLPELPSLRFGRAQPPARRGYRPAPDGLERLFAGYDRGFGPAAPTPTDGMLAESSLVPSPPDRTPLTDALHFDDSLSDEPTWATRAETADAELAKKGGPPPLEVAEYAAPPPPRGAPLPPPSAMFAMAPPAPQAPAPSRFQSAPARSGGAASLGAEPKRKRMAKEAPGGGGGGYDDEGGAGFDSQGAVPSFDEAAPPDGIEPQDAWLDFDQLQLSGPEDQMFRGKLKRRSDDQSRSKLQQAVRTIEKLQAPTGLIDPIVSRGQFDHRYDAEGLIKIPSDGKLHRVAILTAEGSPHLHLITVPRERADVYREAELKNPCDAPLLSGPVEVFVDGGLLTTDSISHVDKGGSVRVGMGCEDRVRVARNVRAEEESTGLLGGSTAMTHTVSIEVSSSLGQPIQIDVLDRMPVSEDKGLTVEMVYEKPPHTPYDQAERGAPIRRGMRWRMPIPAGGKVKIEYQYRIGFSAKSEIIGGNRRD
ncbi:MAG: DUF4139 domain-containing protein [Polyangia bacterium]